jgi:Leucine-rich repeat (LRR) protein
LLSVIVDAFPEGQLALQDPNSPQSMALQWLESSANSDISTVESYLQRYALATLYYATNGNEWNDNTAWLSNTNECSWISTASSLGICDEFGRYTELDLQDNNLRGPLPPEIAILSDTLQSINLRGNDISGAFPTVLGAMVNLEILELSTNSLSGPIPQDLFNLTNLKRLSLFENNLLSTIPSLIGQLTRLELLDVGSNQMTGTIPSTIGQLGRLAGLSVYGNLFTGTLPVEIADLQSLQLLYADSNDFRAPLPTDICLLNLDEFWSDCEEIQCVCCTTCCSEGFGCYET